MSVNDPRGWDALGHTFIADHLRDVSGSGLKVFLALRSWLGRENPDFAFPTIPSIADRAGLSTSTTKIALKELRDLRWIAIEIRSRKGSIVRHGYRILTGLNFAPVESTHRDEIRPGADMGAGMKSGLSRDENHSDYRDEIRLRSNSIEAAPGEEEKNICAEPSPARSAQAHRRPERDSGNETMDPEDLATTLQLNDASEYQISKAAMSEWGALYPAVDVLQELRKMKGWTQAHPARRKTARGILKFIHAWLSRAQDGARPRGEGELPRYISSSAGANARVRANQEAVRAAARARGWGGPDIAEPVHDLHGPPSGL